MNTKDMYENLLRILVDYHWKSIENPMFTHVRGDDYVAISYDQDWCYIGPNILTHQFMIGKGQYFHKGRELLYDFWIENLHKFLK